MIQANELRLGNWVGDMGSQPMQVTAIDIVSLLQCEIAGKIHLGFNPIPLTPEILEKCGYSYRNEHRGKGSIMDFNDTSIGITENGFRFLTAWKAPLDSLHQLQNLYFALTGQELLVNL